MIKNTQELSMIVINKLDSESFHYDSYEIESFFDLSFTTIESWSIERNSVDKYDLHCPIRWKR
jgi:hypothetical protein